MTANIAPIRIGIIGAGYVGLTTGVCLSEVGWAVTCVDNDPAKLALLKAGRSPIFEPGLEALLQKNLASGRLQFSDSVASAVKTCDAIFICVNTPPKPDGQADLRYVEQVAKEIAAALPDDYRVIVDKSTVPVHTAEKVAETIRRYNPRAKNFDAVSNPEFLREGSAVTDTLTPDRIVIGAESPRAKTLLRQIYEPIVARSGAPLCQVSIRSAELIKHGANTFLAAKISFANLIAEVCEAVGANALEVLNAIGLDRRIGADFLRPGIGFGGSCFPKDIAAFRHTLATFGIDPAMVSAIQAINEHAYERFIRRLERELWVLDGKTIGVLGAAFKPNTDDIRNAPALKLMAAVIAAGAKVRAYDPHAAHRARHALPAVTFHHDPYAACQGAEAVVICTDWDEFSRLDWNRMRAAVVTPIIFDGRNVVDRAQASAAGFRYFGVGQ